jgi:hypothetical protein
MGMPVRASSSQFDGGDAWHLPRPPLRPLHHQWPVRFYRSCITTAILRQNESPPAAIVEYLTTSQRHEQRGAHKFALCFLRDPFFNPMKKRRRENSGRVQSCTPVFFLSVFLLPFPSQEGKVSCSLLAKKRGKAEEKRGFTK